MPNFIYKAIDQSGSEIAGVIEAKSVEAAQSLLNNQGLIPSDVREEGSISRGLMADIKGKLESVTMKELILFTKQFRTMLIAGLSILKVLEILHHQSQNIKLKKALTHMTAEIKDGLALHEAFSKHPSIFPSLYVSMIAAGESSGTLPDILNRLVYLLEHEHKVRSDIKSALQYPITVMITLVIAFFVLLTFVIPRFVKIFTNAGLDLPIPTLVCLYLYRFVSGYWYLLLGGGGTVHSRIRTVVQNRKWKIYKGPLYLENTINRPSVNKICDVALCQYIFNTAGKWRNRPERP